MNQKKSFELKKSLLKRTEFIFPFFFYILFNSYQKPKVLHNIEHNSPPITIFIIAWLYRLISHIS